MTDFDAKQYARLQRQKAYQKAKEARKAYLAEKSERPEERKQNEIKQQLKEKARKQRQAAYRAKAQKLKQARLEKRRLDKAKKRDDDKLKQYLICPEKLKLVTFDEERHEFVAMKTPPPKLELVSKNK